MYLAGVVRLRWLSIVRILFKTWIVGILSKILKFEMPQVTGFE
jgi:hypothetical protein